MCFQWQIQHDINILLLYNPGTAWGKEYGTGGMGRKPSKERDTQTDSLCSPEIFVQLLIKEMIA